MALTQLVTKCFPFVSTDAFLLSDHCPACQQQQHSRNASAAKKTTLAKRCCAKSTYDPIKEAKVKKTTNWKLNCAKLISGGKSSANMSSPSSSTANSTSATTIVSSLPAAKSTASSSDRCVGTSYRKVDAEPLATTVGSSDITLDMKTSGKQACTTSAQLSPDKIPNMDCDTKARLERAMHIAQGVLVSDNSKKLSSDESSPSISRRPELGDAPIKIQTTTTGGIHSQVDYMHCLVPDLKKITSSCFYWGKMDRYEAERLLDGKPEGTFLLRDSAQEEFLFSVSFRKYGRSLHARIEQFNHMFSFDCHDPAVSTSVSVTGLLEHYKNPQLVMFFEPALTLPLTRNFVFPLQQLCRATIVSRTTYDGIATLSLPATLKSYLKEYHYKQRVRVKCYD